MWRYSLRKNRGSIAIEARPIFFRELMTADLGDLIQEYGHLPMRRFTVTSGLLQHWRPNLGSSEWRIAELVGSNSWEPLAQPPGIAGRLWTERLSERQPRRQCGHERGRSWTAPRRPNPVSWNVGNRTPDLFNPTYFST
jgi:hypothetical protein